MTFWILAAGLCVVAAAFIVWPLFLFKKQAPAGVSPDRTGFNVSIFEERLVEYQESLDRGEMDESEFDLLSVELKKNLLSEAGNSDAGNLRDSGFGPLPVVLAMLVPLLAVLAYSDIGLSWGAIDDVVLADELRIAQEPLGDKPHDAQQMRAGVAKLAIRLESQPDNHEGWHLLAKSYLSMGEYEKSVQAFKHLLGRFSQDRDLLLYYAEAVYLADDRKRTRRASEAVEAALHLSPDDVTMLEIKALMAFQAGDLQASIDGFRMALAAGADAERAGMINNAIKRVEEDMFAQGLVPAVASSAQDTPAAILADPGGALSSTPPVAGSGGRRLQILVEVADSIDVGASTPVFVFARALKGPPMPLAVQRMVRGALPKLVQLDESMAMMEGMGLANFDQVQVVARISSSGIANVSPDDYEVISATIDLTKDNPVIKLTIKNQVKDKT